MTKGYSTHVISIQEKENYIKIYINISDQRGVVDQLPTYFGSSSPIVGHI